MNCLEFRRHLLEDPYARDSMLGAHESECPACASYAGQVRASEVRIRSLLREVTPPPQMVEQIQLAIRLEKVSGQRRKLWYSMAASVLLVIAVTAFTFIQTGVERSGMALAQSVLDHIDDEAHHLRSAGPTDMRRVRQVFARFDAAADADLGRINFAAECLMRKRTGVHLVLSGEVGPVTVFFMPGETSEQAVSIENDRFQGTIDPTPWGSIAVVGEKGEPVAELAARMASAVRWPTGSGLVHRALVDAPRVAQQ